MEIQQIIKEGEEYLIQMEFVLNRLYETIYLIEKEVFLTIDEIKQTKTFEQSLPYFNHIKPLISFAFKCYIKHRIELTEQLLSFNEDFEKTVYNGRTQELWKLIISENKY